MPTPAASSMLPRLAAFALAALASASLVAWGLQWRRPAPLPLPPTAADTPAAPVLQAPALQALLQGRGAPSTESAVADASASAADRFVLLGVVAQGPHAGAALLAVDDNPPKAYRVGATVADGWQLRTLRPRSAVLACAQCPNAQDLTLLLPPTANASGGNPSAGTPPLMAAPPGGPIPPLATHGGAQAPTPP